MTVITLQQCVFLEILLFGIFYKRRACQVISCGLVAVFLTFISGRFVKLKQNSIKFSSILNDQNMVI